MSELQEKLDAAIWSAHTLFQKGLVSGSTGNISFLHEHRMYISRSGSCFGRLRQEDFAQVDMQGTILYGKPSKEYPMHLALYRESEEYKAFDLIEEMESSAHVYAMLKSCPDEDIDFIPH